ncbi:MAG: TIGR00730 family Rossman fold protein [Candidatus Obscuribacterales bacterium]|nr:TIGR00730 family Rossman fold protein [Candidatus Obscuribacterales bacterium]
MTEFLGPFAAVRTTSLLERAKDVERIFLRGRRNRAEDLENAIRIFLELLRGFDSFDFEGPCVTIFGSARFKEGHRYYEMARELGKRLAQHGYVVMTGGGPGIMEAANRGAKEGGGLSLGCNILVPHETEGNPYVDKFVEFDHFFVRKLLLVKYSCAFIVMPGGVGTLDEVFETLTLIQTKKIEKFPVIAMGQEFWGNFKSFLFDSMIAEGTINQSDLNLLFLTDSHDEVIEIIDKEVHGNRAKSGPAASPPPPTEPGT